MARRNRRISNLTTRHRAAIDLRVNPTGGYIRLQGGRDFSLWRLALDFEFRGRDRDRKNSG
jgi:hypothetical protein